MANINKIECRLKTGDRSGAKTDGDIYLGIGGREFSLDSAADDFERASDRTYIMGEGAGEGSTIRFTALNDPRSPAQLRIEDLDRFPSYIRFEPENREDNWNLESVDVFVNPGPNQLRYQALGGSNNLWLGTNAGKYCYLVKL